MKSSKNILLVLRELRPVVFESIFKYAHQLNWNIEFYGENIPKNWQGDGVIIDYLRGNDIDEFPKNTPIATRTPLIKNNIFAVHGDVKFNMQIVFDFFRSRGYQNYAVLNSHPLKFDPVQYMGQLVHAAGFEYYFLYWCKNYKNSYDFSQAIDTIANFLEELPKPCAIYLGSIWHINLLYRACNKISLRIPNDIAIIANTDDPGYGVNLSPSVSTLVGEFPVVGEKLVKGLDAVMQGKADTSQIHFIPATSINPRQSTDFYAVDHPATMKAIDYILENYSNSQLGLQDIVNISENSSMTLERNFQKYVNRLPSKFIQDIRLDAASKLLLNTNLTLDDIAEKVGYGSNMSLSLAFKRKFNISPGKYRNNHATSK